jgi:mRNA-degrading endonuclease toxin of MazEF toxin-antitoxin module
VRSREIWDIDFPDIGRHPGLIVTTDPLLTRIATLTVAVVTSTEGPPSTHIAIGEEEGCRPSFINVTDLRPARNHQFHRRRGSLSWPKTQVVNRALIVYLDLDSPL